MADTKDYLTVYKRFFDNFAKTVDPDDQLPVRVAGYRLWDNEIVGETVDWTLQYLSQRNCPPSLLAPITRIVIDEVKQAVATQPLACGFRSQDNCYLPLKLMRAVTNKVNEVCLRFCDNGRVTTLPPPSPGPVISSCAIKNSRRCMEDRHVILEDFHAFFNIKDTNPASYYAVFDGHAGTDAAIYSVSHLHQFLAESSYYPTNPEKAIKDAFFRTDDLFIEKSNKENLHSGTTAVCALLRPKEKKLYVAWLGDSQAVLVRNGHIMKLVNPHKPDREDEKTRIQDMGGSVLFWGTWRVNGQLAVSRAIGDLMYKPYVTAEPDVKTIDLLGDEDFLILACDGLWDFVSEEDVVRAVYEELKHYSGDVAAVTQRLVQLSKQQGSTDNITVIVAFLTEPSQLAARARDDTRAWAPANGPQPSAPPFPAMEAFDINTNTTPAAPPSEPTNPFEAADLASPTVCPQKAGAGLLLDIGGAGDEATDNNFQAPPFNNGHTNGSLYAFLDTSPNGKISDDDDSGPETAVDGTNEKRASLLSKNPFGADIELQRQQQSEFDPVNEPRHDTPTPPADDVPGVIGLVSDNVAESGEESEDEWNYYRVDPSEKTAQPSGEKSEKEQQAKEQVCSDKTEKAEESEDSMESQLNPNAAEFVPSPTHTAQSMEDFILSQPKDVSMDNVVVPSRSEFEKEVTSRPSEVDFDNSLFNTTVSSANTSDLLADQDAEYDKCTLSTSQQVSFVNPLTAESELSVEESFNKGPCAPLDESEAFSTKAEYGDESTTSFMTSSSDIQKAISATNIMETSLMEQDFPASEDNTTEGVVLENSAESSVLEQESTFQQDDLIHDFQKEPVHISFELQKEIAPQMESQPERVKVDSVDHSPTIESEPGIESTNDSEDRRLVENLEFTYKNDSLPSQVHGLEDFVTDSNPFSKASESKEESTAVKMDDFFNVKTSGFDEFNIPKEAAIKPMFYDGDNVMEFSRTVEKSVLEDTIESQTIFQSNFINETEGRLAGIHLQSSEYLVDEFKNDLPVQQTSHNQLSNEISTPEYEKLEKVVEASEVYAGYVDVPVDETLTNSVSINDNFNVKPNDGVLLESAHPDKAALLDDACVEPNLFDTASLNSAVGTNLMAQIDASYLETGDLERSEAVASDVGFSVSSPEAPPLQSAIPETEPSALSEVTLQFSEEPVGISIPEESAGLHIPSTGAEPFKTLEQDILQSAQPPPPTPLLSQVTEEPLDFSRDADDIAEVVEKLSASQGTSDLCGIDEVKEADVKAATSETENVQIDLASATGLRIEDVIPIVSTTNDDAPAAAAAAAATTTTTTVVESVKTMIEEKHSDVKLAADSTSDDTLSPTVTVPVDEVVEITNTSSVMTSKVVAASAAVATATIAAVAAAISTDKGSKKDKEVPPKKPTVAAKDKKSSAEKPKTTTKTAPVPSRLTATTAKPKSPTSPVKSSVAAKTTVKSPLSTVPSKPLAKPQVTKTTTRPLSSQPTRTTTMVASRTRPVGSQPPAKPAPIVGLSKVKPTTSPPEKKPITNGDIKAAPKRPEQLLTKTSTSRPLQRPATAPASKTVSKTLAPATATKTKSPSLNGPSRLKTLSSVTQVKTVTKASNEKEIKETANKQISTRMTTTVRSTTASGVLKTATSANRKIESKAVANGKGPAMKPSSMVKSATSSSKVSPKKPATTTRLKSSKAGSVAEKTETVQGSNTVIATNEVKSEVLIETTQTAA